MVLGAMFVFSHWHRSLGETCKHGCSVLIKRLYSVMRHCFETKSHFSVLEIKWLPLTRAPSYLDSLVCRGKPVFYASFVHCWLGNQDFRSIFSVATAIVWMPLNDWVHNFPSTSRNGGRPHHAFISFSCTYFGERNWLKAARSCDKWLAAESATGKVV